MLIGLRVLLLFVILAIAITFLAYLFTKNPRFLHYTKCIIKFTIGFAMLIAVIYVAERFFLR